MNIAFDLNTVWFFLVGILFTGYAVLDGFDLGVGSLHLFTKTDEERRTMLNSIGPVWDGNEVWLVAGGGALFAAFPQAYATVFSGFYFAFILLLVALIFRAVAIEFRSKQPMKWWRSLWDVGFSMGSITSAFLIGVALGNIILGVPLDANHEYGGTFLDLLNPYALLVGVTTLMLFAMHGSIYVALKTEGALQKKARQWVDILIFLFIAFYIATTIVTLLHVPQMADFLKTHYILFLLPLISLIAIINIPIQFRRGNEFIAFLSSCVAVVTLLGLFGLGIYPNIVPSIPTVANSLNIYNAASSQKTHTIMLIVACIGMPLVIAYTASIYWIFRGKVKLEPESY